MRGTRIGIGDGVGVNGGSVNVGLLASDVRVLIEGVLEHWDGNLNGFLLDFLNGNFDLEGLVDSADLHDFLGNLNDDFLHVGGGDLDLVGLVGHLGVLNIAGDLFLVAIVNDDGVELLGDGASTDGSGTSATRFTGASA